MLPDTRPNLLFSDAGVCGACRTHERRDGIDWAARAAAFAALARDVIGLGRPYDCLIPVSGGKDSTWQVATCLEHGLNPLTFSWKPPARTQVGVRNLENLISLGVDHLDLSIDHRVQRALTRRAFLERGAPGLPFHLAMFGFASMLASRFEIPLVVWGENSAVEYGGQDDVEIAPPLDAAWLRRFGVTHGTVALDWVSDELSARDLAPYRGVPDEDLSQKGIRVIFLGDFFRWDPLLTFEAARRHGFEAEPGPRTGFYAYADIDDDLISVHHHLKWFKYGFTRSFDNLSLEIRNGRLTRDAAIAILAERGDETPHQDIDRFCEYLGISRRVFDQACERFRDRTVWTRRDGCWQIDGFLVPGWRWT